MSRKLHKTPTLIVCFASCQIGILIFIAIIFFYIFFLYNLMMYFFLIVLCRMLYDLAFVSLHANDIIYKTKRGKERQWENEDMFVVAVGEFFFHKISNFYFAIEKLSKHDKKTTLLHLSVRVKFSFVLSFTTLSLSLSFAQCFFLHTFSIFVSQQ